MRNVNMFWVLTLFLWGTAHAQTIENYNMDTPQSVCLTQEQADQWQLEISRALIGLPKIPHLRNTTKLIRPIRQADGFDYLDVFALAALVDHDDRKPGYLQDYNCGSFTADGTSHNHTGTDFMLWPFGWHQMDANQAEAVAAAAGQIVHKADGRYDRNCPYRFSASDGNAIFIQHADGTIAWYLNLKAGSLTEKSVGDMVEQGEYLGIVGSSGNSFYPHLHFELRDEEGHVLDPFSGPCNPGESLWADQPSYLESGVNHLTTFTQRPDFNNFCNPAETFFQDTYSPGDTLYFLAFIRQQREGQTPRMSVRYPNGEPLTDRSTTLDKSTARSYFIHSVYLPDDAPAGTYTCLLEYQGQTYQTTFLVNGAPCPVPAQNDLVSEVFSATETQLTYRAKTYSAYQWQIRIKGTDTWTTLPAPSYSVFIRGLSPDTNYEYRLRFRCDDAWSAWSGIGTFSTPADISCPPVALEQTTVELTSANSVDISIQVAGKDAYDWRIRPPGEDWINISSISDSIYTFDGLSSNTTYEYRVRVKCGGQWSAWSNIGSFTTPEMEACLAPDITKVLATPLSSTEVQLTSPDKNKTRYDWRIRTQGSSSWISLPSSASYSVVLQGLEPGKIYDIQHAWQCNANWSSWSASMIYNSPAATCPPPPVDQVGVEYAAPDETTILINSLTASAYQVRYRETGTAEWQESSPSALPSVVIGTEAGKEYEFQVRVFCSEDWSPWTSAMDFTTPEVNPCAAPTLSQTEVSFDSPFDVTLIVKGWTGDPIQMQYREMGADTWLLIEPTGPDSLFFIDNLLDHTIYQFRLRTVCSGIPGSWSEAGLFTTPELKECPEVTAIDILVVSISENAVQLIAPVFPNLRYQWRYRLAEETSWTTLPATQASSIVIEGLDPGTDYEAQLRIICSFETGNWSNSMEFTTSGQAPCAPPNAESILFSDIDSDQFVATLDPNGNKANYRMRYRERQSDTWTTLASATLPFNVSGLMASTDYEIQIAWFCGSSWSDWSATAEVTTLPEVVCHAPLSSNISATDITRETIFIDYHPGQGQRYQWRYRISGTTTWTFLERQPETVYLLSNLDAGTTYEVQIRQECAPDFWSNWSASAEVTTAPPYSCEKPSLTNTEVDQLGPYQVTLRYIGPERNLYQWRVRPSGSNEWTTSASSTIPSRVFGNLMPSTTYQYQLRVDCGEGWSNWSNSGLFTTPAELVCDAPATSDFSITVIDEKTVQLNYAGNTQNGIQWRYQISGSDTWTTSATTTLASTEISELEPGATYSFAVRVQCGDLWSAWSAVRLQTMPEPTSDCGQPPLNQINVYLLPNIRSVRIFISVPDAGAFEWRLRRRGLEEWSRTGVETNTTWLIDDLLGERTYEFQIRALCGDTLSAWSLMGSFTTPIHLYCDDPDLGQATVSDLGQNQVTISLSIPEAQQYHWQYRETGNSVWIDWIESENPATTITGLSPQTTYQYRFRFVCSSGYSDWSPMGAFTTLAPEQTNNCEHPEFLLVPQDDFTVKLTALSDAKLYQWRYRDISTITYIETTAAMTPERVIANLKPNTTYRFQVRVRCMDTWSDWGPAQQYTTPAAEDPCATPSLENVSAMIISDSEVIVGTSDDSPQQFDWRYRLSGSDAWTDLTASTLPSRQLTGLMPGGTYEVQLRVLCDGGWSDWSLSLFFTLTERLLEPNLTCTDLPLLVRRGDSLYVNGAIAENNGMAAADPQTIFFYLSPTGRPGPGALYLDSLRSEIVEPGAQISANMVFNLNGMELGNDTYKVGFEIDVFNEVGESNESDNSCFWNTPEIAPLPPDTCYVPDQLSAIAGLSHLSFSWSGNGQKDLRFDVRYRDIYAPEWTEATNLSDTLLVVTALDPCTEYEWQVRSICPGGVYSQWSVAQEIGTSGCNPSYCYSYGLGDAAYIHAISLNGMMYNTGNDYGYGDHTGEEFRINDMQELNITARATTPEGFDEEGLLFWRFWIDLNQDGDFDDEGEVAAEGTTYGAHLFGPGPISNLNPNQTPYRIRVGVALDRYPQACAVESGKYIEDYQVYVDMGQQGIKSPMKDPTASPIMAPISLETNTSVRSETTIGTPYPNPASGAFRLPLNLKEETEVTWEIRDAQGSRRLLGILQLPAGIQELSVDTRTLTPGFYQIIIHAGSLVDSRPLVIR